MRRKALNLAFLVLGVLGVCLFLKAANGGWTLVGWNNLGMHCMDSDYTVFSILPPYNTIQAHLMDSSGRLITASTNVTVTYEALLDPAGSINTTSIGKTTFWQQVLYLFGISLPEDLGLAGMRMPGAQNQPQQMKFDAGVNAFMAEGIPITPYDDAGQKNPYSMMHLAARDLSGNILATTDIVLPVSDEMDCRACHASDASAGAQPSAGWVRDTDPERDYRLNILLLHDQKNSALSTYKAALSTAGYDAGGLYPTVVNGKKPVLCARCHASNALAGTGYSGIAPLTQAVHGLHAGVTDPTNAQTLDASTNRSACYRCHPGALTRCLRGVMGNSVAPDGSMAIQCQNCHGSMSAVGLAGRQGWLNEPACQSCHTGTAVSNSGQIRYTSALDSSGSPRVPANSLFATNPDTPAVGISLYRFSSGHGGLQCSACHHSTHAEYPSSHLNDNIQALQLQSHIGMISECSTCHNAQPNTITGGPHGMHPTGQGWASNHDEAVEAAGNAGCQTCHGSDYRGTVLSRMLGDRNISTRFGAKQFWRGFQIGCYTCHNGPGSERANPSQAPIVVSDTATAKSGTPTSIPLKASSPGGSPIQLRIVSQPAHGTVALNGTSATYFPFTGYAGPDAFIFAASDGSLDSNLGTITLTVTQSFLIPFYQAGSSNYMGFAVTNYSSSAANLQFNLFGADGNRVSLPANPSSYTLQPLTQLAKLGSEIFGTDTSAPQSGWVQMTADGANLGCFFQFGSALQLDGSVAQTQLSQHFRFTRVLEGQKIFRGQTAATYLSIANPNSQSITLSLNLYGSLPNQVLAPTQTKTVPAQGVLYGSISELFGQSLSVSGAYVDVLVTSGAGAAGFELIQFPDTQTVLGLNAVSDSGASVAYSAQLASNSNYFTNLKLINIGSVARVLTVRAVSDNGTDIVPAVKLSLDSGQSIEQDVAQVLGLVSGAEAIGSLIVSSDGSGILGDVIFGDPAALNFAASLPLQTQTFKQAVLNHVANGDGYFTGLALFNPSRQAATVTLQVYSETGSKTGQTTTLQLNANSRISRLLTQLVPAATGQMRGFVMLNSTQPLIAQQLFGDVAMAFLSAVPPTVIQ